MLHPEGLYSHQAKSLEASLGGKHVGICTSTASGKSLCFTLPAANELLRDRNSRAIFLYPNKALSNDQTQKLTGFLSFLRLGGLVKKLDGDVVGEERKKAVAAGRVLLSTPDVLHTSMLRLNREPGYDDIFKSGSMIALLSGQKGTVLEYFLENGSVSYLLEKEDGRQIKIRDNGNLTLIEGSESLVCLVCGLSGLDFAETVCPACEACL